MIGFPGKPDGPRIASILGLRVILNRIETYREFMVLVKKFVKPLFKFILTKYNNSMEYKFYFFW